MRLSATAGGPKLNLKMAAPHYYLGQAICCRATRTKLSENSPEPAAWLLKMPRRDTRWPAP